MEWKNRASVNACPNVVTTNTWSPEYIKTQQHGDPAMAEVSQWPSKGDRPRITEIKKCRSVPVPDSFNHCTLSIISSITSDILVFRILLVIVFISYWSNYFSYYLVIVTGSF
jgi:hypothetical protein